MDYHTFCQKFNICGLNEQQEAAVRRVNGATLLLAVPGSGKTTVIVARTGYLMYVAGVKPENILTITYTRAAAKEMKERFIKKFAPERIPAFSTINSFCLSVINTCAKEKYIHVPKLVPNNESIVRAIAANPIVGNSLKINQGCTNLTFTNTFCFIERSAPEEILRTACAFYVKAVKKFGLENVILLNPFRNKGLLSVNEFNRQLQNLINPPIEGEESIKIRKLEFRPRDLVMQTKNTEIAMNGDIGVIHEISKMPDPDDMNRWTYIASIEFNGDGKRHDYTPEMMQDLDLAYCTTVHKSQGSEYQTVIMVVSEEHKVMLKRNIVYTGVTRAKQNVALIGQTEALNTAILNNQTDVRHTLLGDRLHAAFTVIS